MVPDALFAARRAARIGYLPLITAALCILPVRAAIASAGSDFIYMAVVQILDGLAAGLMGVAVPGYIVRLLNGRGHTNAGQSFIMLMQGAGATLSPAIAGSVASETSYSLAFTLMGGVAATAFGIWILSRNILNAPQAESITSGR